MQQLNAINQVLLLLKECRQMTFVTLNRFCPLSSRETAKSKNINSK